MAVKHREDEGDNLWNGRIVRADDMAGRGVAPDYRESHLDLPAFMVPTTPVSFPAFAA